MTSTKTRSESLKGETLLITGANRGIGRVLLEHVLDRGAERVYAAVRRPSAADPLVARHGERVRILPMDLTDSASIQRAAEQANDVTIVINNGGMFLPGSALSPEAPTALNQLMEVNVNGLIAMAQAFAPVLKANGGGVFVQLNSIVSMKTFPDFALYSASKAASYAITQGLSLSLAEQGTRVISLHPGPIATDMGDAAGLTAVAEPPAVVAEALVQALEENGLHVFPDSMARQIGDAYGSFATAVVEAEPMEA
jgi:NAD(P)-dependent dehydrogenase (short-subunit alcohol dehydrogenase family)